MRAVDHLCSSAIVFVILATATAAHADEPWMLSLEGAGALAVTRPQSAWFEPGGSARLTLWRSLASSVAIGARVGGVVLGDGPAPDDLTLADPGAGGILSLGLGARLRLEAAWDESPRRATGPWIDAFAAAVLTGTLVRPALEVGLGFSFEVGDVDIGPMIRWMTVFETESQLERRPANLLLVGIEMVLFDARPAAPLPEPVRREPTPPRRPSPRAVETASESDDADGDGVPDVRDACPNEAEIVNAVDDHDGCPDEGLIELVDDRVVLEERVLFDRERSRVRRRAMPVLRAIVELSRQHPEWIELRVEGHSDARGSREYNQTLSAVRAQRVREALVALGISGEIITSVGHGERLPRSRAGTESAHQRNRRVEFVVVRRTAPVDGGSVQ